MVDVLCWRDRATKRETRLVNMLLFIKNNVWKVHIVYIVHSDWLEYSQTLFGKEADSLEQATDVPGTCILDNNTLFSAHSLTIYQIICLKKNL